MDKIYYKFDSMRRGLTYYHVSGITQVYDKDLVWFVHKDRIFNSFMYVLADKVEFIIENRKLEFSKGNLIYIPKWIKYKVIISGINTNDIAVIQTFFNIKDELDNEYFYSDLPEKLLDVTPKPIIESMKKIADATLNLLYPSFVINKNLFSILEYLQTELPKKPREDKYKKISTAIEFISNNLSSNTSVTELARMCAMSETAFRTSFKSATGMSPCNYKNYLKIQKSMDIIADKPRLSVSRLTEQLGFNDESYFYKVFYKYANVSYSEFKDKHQ